MSEAKKESKFNKPVPVGMADVEDKMIEIENKVIGKKPLPDELISGDKNSQLAFTVRIEKDLKERLTFYVHMLKRSGDRNISVASTVENILREKVNEGLEEFGYDTKG